MNSALTVSQLSLNIDDKTILSDIAFALNNGDKVAIIGANGAGKSSLLKCLVGIYQPTLNSNIRIQQHALANLTPKHRAQHIAYLAQQHDAQLPISVLDVIRMGLVPHKPLFSGDSADDKANITKAIAQFSLQHLINKRFMHLSGGEQQRVLLASCFLQQSAILLLDEPTSFLDVYYQHQLLQFLTQTDKTVLISLHDINLAMRYCTKVLLLHQGKQLFFGDINQLTAEQLSQAFTLPCVALTYQSQKLWHFLPSKAEVN